MKKILLIITAVAFATFSFSQQLSRYVVASGGNYSTASGISVSSTIGEPMVTTLTAGSNILTQGFQQSFSAPVDPTIVITNPLEGDNLNLMDFEQEQIEPISTLPTSSLTPLAATPPINANAIQDMRVNANVMQTGLTPTEQALLSPEEQAIRLRQRGMARA